MEPSQSTRFVQAYPCVSHFSLGTPFSPPQNSYSTARREMHFCKQGSTFFGQAAISLTQIQSVLIGAPIPLLVKAAAWIVSRNTESPMRELTGTILVETQITYSPFSRELLVHTPPLTPPRQASLSSRTIDSGPMEPTGNHQYMSDYFHATSHEGMRPSIASLRRFVTAAYFRSPLPRLPRPSFVGCSGKALFGDSGGTLE